MIKLNGISLILIGFLLICGFSTRNPIPAAPIVIPTLPALDTLPPVRVPLTTPPVMVSGVIERAGQTDHGGTEIYLTRPGCLERPAMIAPLATTDPAGRFAVQAAILPDYVGQPLITTTQASCLIAVYPHHLTLELFPIQSTTLTLTLPAGDVNEDGRIDLFDMTLLSHALGTDTPQADLNGDGQVDLLDMTLAARYYNVQP